MPTVSVIDFVLGVGVGVGVVGIARFGTNSHHREIAGLRREGSDVTRGALVAPHCIWIDVKCISQ